MGHQIETLEEAIAVICELENTVSKQNSRIRALSEQSVSMREECERLNRESKHAIDWSKHPFHIDHKGFIWIYDSDTGEYGKSKMRICDLYIADGVLTTVMLADGAVTSDKIGAKEVKEQHIGTGAVGSRAISDSAVTAEKISPFAVLARHIGLQEVKTFHIGRGEVKTGNLSDGAVTPRKIDPELLNHIYSVGAHGYALSNVFGDSSVIGVSQKTITDAINRLWSKIEDMTGETLQGINMVVSPDYFVSEVGEDIHVTASTVEANGVFEKIQFFGNGTLIAEYENADYVEFDAHIDETTVIMCKAKIMGIEYTREHIVTHYNSFLLGSGDDYHDLMLDENRWNPDYIIPITNGMRGAYNVRVEAGKRVIIVVGESLASGFLRADLNSVEIPMTEAPITVDGKGYRVFTSEPWSEGDYNIDING